MEQKRRVGDREIVTYEWHWQECETCGKPASHRVTHLLKGSRNNPASSAYGRNDCSWCSDEETFGCRRHYRALMSHPPAGYEGCSAFPLKRFKHMGFYRMKSESAEYEPLAAAQLILATLCDIVLGEDATDRSDEALIRAVRALRGWE